MKRFVFKLSVIVAIFLGLAVFGEISLRRIPNDYSYKKNWLDNHAQDVEVLIYGASDAYFGINPEFLSKKAFNVSHVSQTLGYEKFIFDKYLEKYDSLKYAIIAVHYATPWAFLENSVESWRCKNYNIYYGDTVKLYDPRFIFKIMDFSPMTLMRAFKSWTGYNEVSVDENGFGIAYSIDNRSPIWNQNAEQDAIQHTYDDLERKSEQYLTNKEYLCSIIETCKSRDIKVLLVTTPVYEGFRKGMSDRQLLLQRAFCDEVVKTYDNVLYYDFLEATSFVDDDFFDPGHLSNLGAQKLSCMINDSIIKQEIKLTYK